jgi:hypothetical protein
MNRILIVVTVLLALSILSACLPNEQIEQEDLRTQ